MKNKNIFLITLTLLSSYCIKAQTLTFHNGATILIETGGILTTESNLEIPNGGIENNGTIRFGGSSAKNFDANGQSLKGIVEFNGGSTTLTDKLTIKGGTDFGTIKITGTGALITSNNLTLESDSIGYAGRIDEITSSASTPIVSNSDSIVFYTTRGYNAFRYFGNPFRSVLTVKQFCNDTLEFDVTGNGGTANGFSVTTITNNPSAFWYNEATNKWTGYTNASDSVKIGYGAAFYVQNRKGQPLLDMGAELPEAARISIGGKIGFGTIVTELKNTNEGWNLIANPYPSHIKLSTGKLTNQKWKNTRGTIYMYDKKNKSYISYNRNNGAATGKMTDVIPMGGAFLVQAVGNNAEIEFNEGVKVDDLPTSQTSNPHFFTVDSLTNRFGITLINNSSNDKEEDQVVFLFGNDKKSTDYYDIDFDSKDLTSEVVNLAIFSKDNYKLAVSSYPDSISSYLTKSFPLSFFAKNTGSFTFRYDAIASLEEGTEVWLKDKKLNSETRIDINSYTFSIDQASQLKTDNRFEIYFKNNSTVLSSEPLTSNEGISVYPNPIHKNGMLYIETLNNEPINEISIVDLNGAELFHTSNLIKSKNSNSIQMPNLNSGIYILNIHTFSNIHSQKIIVNP